MSTINSTGGYPGPVGEPSEPQEVDELVKELRATEGSGPSLLGFLDTDGPTRGLAEKLLSDGRISADDVKKLVKGAKDFERITDAERKVFVELLRDHGDRFAPDAREALCRFFGLSLRRPQIGAAPPQPRTPDRSLADLPATLLEKLPSCMRDALSGLPNVGEIGDGVAPSPAPP
ncbi:hypothetical protein ACFL59_07920 [Planctomycetota bacterium]